MVMEGLTEEETFEWRPVKGKGILADRILSAKFSDFVPAVEDACLPSSLPSFLLFFLNSKEVLRFERNEGGESDGLGR